MAAEGLISCPRSVSFGETDKEHQTIQSVESEDKLSEIETRNDRGRQRMTIERGGTIGKYSSDDGAKRRGRMNDEACGGGESEAKRRAEGEKEQRSDEDKPREQSVGRQ